MFRKGKKDWVLRSLTSKKIKSWQANWILFRPDSRTQKTNQLKKSCFWTCATVRVCTQGRIFKQRHMILVQYARCWQTHHCSSSYLRCNVSKLTQHDWGDSDMVLGSINHSRPYAGYTCTFASQFVFKRSWSAMQADRRQHWCLGTGYLHTNAPLDTRFDTTVRAYQWKLDLGNALSMLTTKYVDMEISNSLSRM